MAGINAGVVMVTKFVQSTSSVFSSYIDYVDRDEAQRNEGFEKFSAYTDYMSNYDKTRQVFSDGRLTHSVDNPEKTTHLFTAERDELTVEQKKQLKQSFSDAQANKSLMWQTVISFDNRWLKEQGLFNPDTGRLDEQKLMAATRGCMKNMLESEGLNNSAVWSAAVHFNTDNIHIHVATVEPEPMRRKMEIDGKEVTRGKFKYSSIKKGKSYVVNSILHDKEVSQLLGDSRDTLIKGMKEANPLYHDKDFRRQFLNIYTQLPGNTRLWNYNMNAISPELRKQIDKLSLSWLENHSSNEFQKYKAMIEHQQKQYAEAYGKSAESNYDRNKLNDLYARLGNTILKKAREYDKKVMSEAYRVRAEQRRERNEEAREENRRIYRVTQQEWREYSKETYGADGQRGTHVTFKDHFARLRKGSPAQFGATLQGAMQQLNKAMKEDMQNILNKQINREIERKAERDKKKEEEL